jgi:hypothetical protein
MKRLTRFLGAVALVCLMAGPALASEPSQAVDDYVDTANKVTHIDVLANDTTSGATTLRISNGPSNGEAVVIANGSPKIKYTTYATGPSIDTFGYELCDESGSCSTATVTVGYGQAVPATTTTTPSSTTTSAPSATTTTSAAPVTTPTPPTTDTTAAPSNPPAPEPSTGEEQVDLPDPTTTTISPEPSSLMVLATPTAATPKVHVLAETTLGSHDRLTAGIAIGEPRGVRLGEDVAYLGRSGMDTLALVATPALMVSGIVGFLMIGLPQNALGSALGFLAAFRRRKK